ncbi:MAG: hypothetical protein ACRCWY_10320 [Cellulosilyticaceae bacterium]
MDATQDKDLSLEELVELTESFIKLADELHEAGKLSDAEYDELTYIKKDFLIKVEKEKEEEYKRCF